jgi:hypothetical protein
MSRTTGTAPLAPSNEAGPVRPPDRRRLSRRAAWVLVAAGVWTLYVWITRIFIMAGQDESAGFKVVHGVLAVISIAFGLAVGWIGIQRLRTRSE